MHLDHRARPVGERRRLVWILLTAVAATAPLMVRGNSCGHDFDFHVQSWLQVAQQWRHGMFYPHWVAGANFGAGEPRFVFYPPASWMLGALLGTLLPWREAGAAFALIALVGSGLGLYALAREWAPRDAAALAACLYIVNPYAMFVAYERTAYSELLAGVWLPLVLLFALRSRPESRYNVALLAGSVAGVWLTNAPAAVMVCYMLAVVAVIAAISERAWWPASRAAAGGVLGIAAAAFYIVPAAYERRWVDIGRAIGPGMRVEDSFIFGRTGEAFHDQVLRTASWIAVAMLAATAAAAVAAWRAGGFHGPSQLRIPTRVWRSLVALPVLVLVLMLPFSDFVWRHTPELAFLQFPWRWLMVVGVALAMFAAFALARHFGEEATGPPTRFRIPVVAFLALVVMIGVTQALFWQPCDEEDMISAQVAVFHGGGFEGTDEYTTPATDNEAIQQGLPPIRVLAVADADEADSSAEQNPAWPQDLADDENASRSSQAATVPARLEVRDWKPESKAFTVTTTASGFAVLRLEDYPAWEVRVNGLANTVRPHRVDGLMTIPLRGGVSVVDIHYAVTRDVRWGRAITIVALVLVLLLLVLRQRRDRR